MLAAVGADEGTALTAVVAKAPLRPEWAVFANGVYAHSIELDDTHSASSLHPAVVTIPAALATAELQGSSGEELLTAIVAGYEVACRLGRALDPQKVYARGFHPTGDRRAVRGRGGDGEAARPLVRRARARVRHRGQPGGGPARVLLRRRLDEALPPRLGLAQRLPRRAARTGRVHGPAARVRGARRRCSRATAPRDRAALAHGGPRRARSSSPRRASSRYACCRYNQGPIDLAIALASEHDLGPDDIARVRVGVVSQAIPIVVEPIERKLAPTNDVDAQFSLPYAIGLGIALRKATLDEYAEPTLSSPAVRAVAAKVVAEVRPDFDERFPALWPAEVEIETRRRAHAAHADRLPEGRSAEPAELRGDVREVPLARVLGAVATTSSMRSSARSPTSSSGGVGALIASISAVGVR